MPITADDLKLFAAAYQDDTVTGGGPMTSKVVQTGVENNVFPDIDAAARASGRVQLRKVFVAVTAANADPLMGAQVSFVAGSSDSAVDVVAFVQPPGRSMRPDALALLQKSGFHWSRRSNGAGNAGFAVPIGLIPGQPYKFQLVDASDIVVGSLIAINTDNYTEDNPSLVTWVTEISGANPYTITVADAWLKPNQASGILLLPLQTDEQPVVFTGAVTLSAASTPSAPYQVSVNRVLARVVPVPLRADGVRDGHTNYPTVVTGLTDTYGLKSIGGVVPLFRKGDAVIIRNGNTSETVNVAGVDYTGKINFTTPLVNTFPQGSTVSTLLPLGDLQASVGPAFTQQTWTRTFSDALLGSPIGQAYDLIAGSIATTNAGAETDRWAIVFSSTAAFNLISEVHGQIASGTTSADFAPLNPVTGSPYFTITKQGWGTGWAIGNVLRFNTTGARAAIWLARCVSQSPAGALNTPSLEMRGSVNA